MTVFTPVVPVPLPQLLYPSPIFLQDFIVSIVFSILWLISSCVWAQGVTDIKYYIDPKELFNDIVPECHKYPDASEEGIKCEVTTVGNFAPLNVSLVNNEIFIGFIGFCTVNWNEHFCINESIKVKVKISPGMY